MSGRPRSSIPMASACVADTRPSEATLATLREVRHHGVSGTGLTIAELTIAASWNLQGDPARPGFAEEARRLFDVALPTRGNTTTRSDTLTALWLGPRSWLLVAGGASSLSGFTEKRDAINRQRGALFDVSASRVAWALAGPRAPDVLRLSAGFSSARLCRRSVRAERVRSHQRTGREARRDTHLRADGRAKLRARCQARAVRWGSPIWVRRAGSATVRLACDQDTLPLKYLSISTVSC